MKELILDIEYDNYTIPYPKAKTKFGSSSFLLQISELLQGIKKGRRMPTFFLTGELNG